MISHNKHCIIFLRLNIKIIQFKQFVFSLLKISYFAYLWSPLYFSIISLKTLKVINLLQLWDLSILQGCNLSQQEDSTSFKVTGYFFSNFFTHLERHFSKPKWQIWLFVYWLLFDSFILKYVILFNREAIRIKLKLLCLFLSFCNMISLYSVAGTSFPYLTFPNRDLNISWCDVILDFILPSLPHLASCLIQKLSYLFIAMLNSIIN